MINNDINIKYCPSKVFIEEKLKEKFKLRKHYVIYNDIYKIRPKWATDENRIFYERNMTEELMRVGKISISVFKERGICDGCMYLGSDYYLNIPSIFTEIKFQSPRFKWDSKWGRINFYFNPRISGNRFLNDNIEKEKSYRTFPYANDYSPSLFHYSNYNRSIFPKSKKEYDPILHSSIIISLHISYFRVSQMLGISEKTREQLSIYQPRALMIYEWFSDIQIQEAIRDKALEWRIFLENLIINNEKENYILSR